MSYTITDMCNGCGACVRICPVDAIRGEKEEIHIIEEYLCIECGACGKICPVDAIQDQSGALCVRVKRSEWEKPQFNNKKCMSCEICIDACPVDCLGLSPVSDPKDPHGYPYMENEKACIGCGYCALECPVDAITMIVPEPALSDKHQASSIQYQVSGIQNRASSEKGDD